MAPDPSSPEVLPWLKSLPLAPEYCPTLSEFRDPIAYILKIEPEASRFGICKIVPPLPAAPKLTAVANLNLSFSARSPSGDPTFTTRQQQIGFCPRRPRPVQKSVWQSGIHYTLPQFEAKARTFERAHLPRSRKKKSSSSLPPLEVETLYWKAAADKPFSVEYANDMPGSGFAELREEETVAAAENVGETAWNMRGVARSKGSLLRFMREEIPGVTSPMVYVAMMFSWFAWHVEDHELHSLNYLHMGAGKTWYGVPRDAALAFEDVIRVHGYGGEVNPLITFATLAEKTTVMSPEVLIGSGIPCCRLVQNAGEFVVTFPGSYHTGFSHGFNCGEASNISTPEWLKVAKEAAIRRASTNSPPMVSHYQLLYALSLSLFLRSPINMVSSPKSSRLKNKLRGVGETMIKETFVENMIQNNNLLSILLDDGSSCVILPQRTSDPLYSSLHLKLQMNIKPRIALGLCSGEDKMEGNSVPYLSMGSRSTWTRHLNGFSPAEENSLSVYQRRNSSMTKVSRFESSGFHHSTSEMQHIGEVQTNKFRTDGFLDKGLLSCVTCGILNYACVAVIQPREATAGYLMSTVFNSFANQIVSFEEKCDLTNDVIRKTLDSDVDINIGNREMIHSSHHVPVYNYDFLSDAKVERGASALDLLASVYGDLSDSEEAAVHDTSVCTDGNRIIHSSPTCNLDQKSTCPFSSESISHNRLPSKGITFGNPNYQSRPTGICTLSKLVHSTKVLAESCYEVGSFSQLHGNCKDENVSEEQMWFLAEKLHDNIAKAVPNSLVDNSKIASNSLIEAAGNLQYPEARRDLGSTYEIDQTAINSNDMILKHLNSDSSVFHHRGSSNDSAITGNTTSTSFCTVDDSIKNSCVAIVQASDRDFSRMHVFCLEHAVEVEKRLRAIGGVNMLLLCHPEYPKMETEAKLLAKELGLKHHWKDVQFRNSTEQDQEKIRIAVDDEEVIPCNGDWTVKLGINLYYSVNLSKSPLFKKQLPYNEVIYKSFGQKLPAEQKSSGRVPRRQKKIILAGKWCGKVWMSNQVHPFLADLNITDHDEIDQKSDKVDRDIENENQSILPKRSSSNNSATARRKSSKKRNNLAFRSSTRKPSRTKLDKSSDTGYAEEHSVSADGDPDTDLKSEDDTDIEDEKQVIQPARNSANDSAAARMKSSKKAKILTVRSRTRKSAYTRLENSSDSGCGEEIFGYADDVPDTDQKSEADSYIEDEKKAILPRRNSTKGNAAARRISVKRRSKLAVSSSTRKHSHTRIDDSSDVGYAEENSAYADSDPELDQRLGDATDIENDTQAILPRRNSMNNNATVRRKSIKKRTESVVRSSTRKPAHTRLDNSSDTGYAEENPGYVDNDQVADQIYEDETDLESKKQEILPRGNLTNNNSTRRKSGRKRKRSTASCTRKPAHTRLDSSGGAGHAEVDSSAKSGRNLSCLRSTSKGSTRKPPSMRLRKQWLKSGEAKTIVAPEKCNKKKRLRKAPDSDPGKEDYPCDVEGCCMSFATKHDLVAHKRNVCPEKGCGKKFFSHKYLLQHQKVHSDDRPLKCPWKGCKMTFKWAWARTEHIRVHTGERPYVCGEPGCEQTFRFVSDFSRHRRKTGHCSAKKGST